MKLKFSIKNLRERLAKGLVDKGVLGTESQSFGLFEMATHPLKDASVKEEVIFRVQVRRRPTSPWRLRTSLRQCRTRQLRSLRRTRCCAGRRRTRGRWCCAVWRTRATSSTTC